MIDFDNRTSLDVDISMLELIASSLSDKEIELILTDNEEIREINREFRSIDKDTDVLSFPFEDLPMAPLGSIVISNSHIEQKAKEFGHSINDEFTLLFIHGLLHLLGYNHEIDQGQMRLMEQKLIEKYDLPQSLIVRNEG